MDTTITPQRAGRIELALQKIFTRKTLVLEIEDIGQHFRLITLGGDALRPGDSCAFLGPRKSIRLAPAASPVILFGDETSLGLAAALSAQASTYMLFDAGAHVHAAIERLRLPNAGTASDARELQAQMTALLQAHPDADIVLTGKAGAIQQMTRLLHQHGTAAKRRQTKAYWAPGKTGLD